MNEKILLPVFILLGALLGAGSVYFISADSNQEITLPSPDLEKGNAESADHKKLRQEIDIVRADLKKESGESKHWKEKYEEEAKKSAGSDSVKIVEENTALKNDIENWKNKYEEMLKKYEPEKYIAKLDPKEQEALRKKLTGKLDSLMEEKNGMEFIKTLHELAKLGQLSEKDTVHYCVELVKAWESGAKLGLSDQEYYTAWGGPLQPLMTRSMTDETLDPTFRIHATWTIPWYMPKEEVVKLYSEQMVREKDPRVLDAILTSMMGQKSETSADSLIQTFERSDIEDSARQKTLQALAATPGENVTEYLRNLERNGKSSELRHSATVALGMRFPAASGLMITYIYPESQAGMANLEIGDILTEYGSAKILNLDDLNKEKLKYTKDDNVSVVYFRGGRSYTVTIKGDRLGINGNAVKKSDS